MTLRYPREFASLRVSSTADNSVDAPVIEVASCVMQAAIGISKPASSISLVLSVVFFVHKLLRLSLE